MPVKFDWTKVKPAEDFRFAPALVRNRSGNGHSLPLRVYHPKTGSEETLIFQAPKTTIAFPITGVTDSDKGDDAVPRYRVSLSFAGVHYNPDKKTWSGPEEMVKFLKFIMDIEEYNMLHRYEHHNPDNKTKEVSDDKYNKSVWIGDKCKTGEYPPTMRARLMVAKGDIATKFFNKHGEPIDFSTIEGENSRGLWCIPLLQVNSMWFVGKQFGMCFNIKQMVVYERDQFVGCAISLPSQASEEEQEEADECLIESGECGEEGGYGDDNYGDDDDEEEKGNKKRKNTRSSSSDSKRPKATAEGFVMPET